MANNKVPLLVGGAAVIGLGYVMFKKSFALGKLTLTIGSGPNGSTTPEPGAYQYAANSQVMVYGEAAPGYKFDHWSGDVAVGQETVNPITLLMLKNMAITANFVINPTPAQFTVTFESSAGGSVSPAGSHPYPQNSYVTVQAAASAGYRFVGWSGDWTGMDNPTMVHVTRNNMVVRANFTPVAQNGVALQAGTNNGITYGGATGPIRTVLASVIPYADTSGASYAPLLWIYKNGQWLCWHPESSDPSDGCNPNRAGALTTIFQGDMCYIHVNQACFWTWL